MFMVETKGKYEVDALAEILIAQPETKLFFKLLE